MRSENRSLWWHGGHGEWYVVAQIALIALVFLGPRTLTGLPEWPAAGARFWGIAGATLILAGACTMLAGLVWLGSNVTPLPHPKAMGTLIQSGPYRFVRHPMYAGGILIACGWAFVVQGWLTLVYAAALYVFVEIKSAREERWLVQKFPDYPTYQRRVRKLIPFIR